MTGGLIQLVSYGAENIYLMGNPKLSFFKCVYKRHTNFATEYIEESFNKSPDFGKTSKCLLPRSGDLIHKVFVKMKLPALKQDDGNGNGTWVGYINGIGTALLEDVSIEIGGQVIDRHKSEWLDIWNELTNHDENYHEMIGNYQSDYSLRTNALSAKTYYVPLQFWFCKHSCASLPLIALQYHEVILSIDFRDANRCIKSDVNISSPLDSAGNALSITEASVLIEYIFLDRHERTRFAENTHDYLIDQVQTLVTTTIDANRTNATVDLKFFHPVKELVWVVQKTTHWTPANSKDGNHILTYSDPSNNKEMFLTSNLLFGGKPRYALRDAKFFRITQPHSSHSFVPDKRVYMYSFSLHPEKYQPTGACNFGKIDNIQLYFKFDSSTSAFYTSERQLKVFALNYNIFRVKSGMGGVAFST